MPSLTADRAIIDALDHNNALLKFISPNDKGLTGGHQYGFYLPKSAWRIFSPNHPPLEGHNFTQNVQVFWHDGFQTESCIKWYGAKTRSEFRLTRFGQDFPHLAASNVGDLLILIRTGDTIFHGYVFALPDDIADIQASLGVEIIRTWGLYEGAVSSSENDDNCINERFEDFIRQIQEFPDTGTISRKTREAVLSCIRAFPRQKLDNRLMLLMDNEYSLFRMVERKLCQNETCRQFLTVDDFLSTASRLMNRRKARAGRALENHVGYLFQEAHIPFDTRPNVDGQPDILIPGKAEYENPDWSEDCLYVVGVKTTCKDRWRQVLNEARRVRRKHILTLQQGISARQMIEMRDSNVTLVVPKSLHSMFPLVEGMELLSVQDFVEIVRNKLRPLK